MWTYILLFTDDYYLIICTKIYVSILSHSFFIYCMYQCDILLYHSGISICIILDLDKLNLTFSKIFSIYTVCRERGRGERERERVDL